jgi:hypothetical protein
MQTRRDTRRGMFNIPFDTARRVPRRLRDRGHYVPTPGQGPQLRRIPRPARSIVIDRRRGWDPQDEYIQASLECAS